MIRIILAIVIAVLFFTTIISGPISIVLLIFTFVLLLTSFTCKSSGKLEQVDGKFMMSEVTLEPSITITDEKDMEKAERILQKSEAVCLISNSIKSTIKLITTIKVGR